MQADKGKLILCPTPLGNLGDITLRALDVLKSADVICAEDTRVTGKLLAAYDIQKRLERLDETMISTQTDVVIGRVLAGETVVFCSDAGMPGIADPGARLVAAAHEAGAPVEVLPGANAATTAFVASGFPSSSFYFGGFFPRKDAERQRVLETLKSIDAALIFYESPRRVVAALSLIAQMLPYRKVSLCRELTKVHEEVFCGLASVVLEEFSQRAQEGAVKGEIVLVIEGPTSEETERHADESLREAAAYAAVLRSQGEMSHKDITRSLQSKFGISRNDAYRIAQEN